MTPGYNKRVIKYVTELNAQVRRFKEQQKQSNHLTYKYNYKLVTPIVLLSLINPIPCFKCVLLSILKTNFVFKAPLIKKIECENCYSIQDGKMIIKLSSIK